MGAGISYASQGGGGMIYIAHDILGEIGNSATETIVATCVIPAHLLRTRCIITASCGVSSNVAHAVSSTFKLKIGATGSEATTRTKILTVDANIALSKAHCNFIEADTSALNYTVENTVLLTAQNSEIAPTLNSSCYQLLVVGY